MRERCIYLSVISYPNRVTKKELEIQKIKKKLVSLVHNFFRFTTDVCSYDVKTVRGDKHLWRN